MQSDNPMVMEVNRLVGDLLAGGERLLLPGIGSLTAVTRPAYRISKKEVIPPLRGVEFSSREQGLSLVDRIAVAAACTVEESEEVYRRWLSHTQQEGVLTIEGVGVLKQHHFTVDEAFDRRLNPGGRKPIAVRRRRRFDWMIALGVVAILVAGGIAWYGYQLMQQKPIPQVQPVESTYTPADTTAVVAPTDSVTMSTASTTSAAKPAVTPVAATQEVQRMVSGHYYVVLGVFSTEENAKRAVAEAAKGADPLTCSIYYFGQKWMVSPATSALASETNAFRQAHSAAYPDLWVYQAK